MRWLWTRRKAAARPGHIRRDRMSIIFTEQDKIFTLHTKDATYQMKVDAYGFLLHLYYGRKTEGNMDYLLQFADRGFSGNPFDVGNDRTYSMDVLPQKNNSHSVPPDMPRTRRRFTARPKPLLLCTQTLISPHRLPHRLRSASDRRCRKSESEAMQADKMQMQDCSLCQTVSGMSSVQAAACSFRFPT
mgnify:CR=1 FL=1